MCATKKEWSKCHHLALLGFFCWTLQQRGCLLRPTNGSSVDLASELTIAPPAFFGIISKLFKFTSTYLELERIYVFRKTFQIKVISASCNAYVQMCSGRLNHIPVPCIRDYNKSIKWHFRRLDLIPTKYDKVQNQQYNKLPNQQN